MNVYIVTFEQVEHSEFCSVLRGDWNQGLDEEVGSSTYVVAFLIFYVIISPAFSQYRLTLNNHEITLPDYS